MMAGTVRRDIRAFWVALSVVLIAGIIGSFVMAGRTRDREEAAATAHAVTVVEVGVGPLFEPAEFGDPVEGERYEEIARQVRGNILSDDTFTEIIVWATDGTVLFATNRDLVGQEIVGQRELVKKVSGEGAESHVVSEVYQTFVPVRLGPGEPAVAVAQMNQPYAPVWAAANRPWRYIGIGLGGFLLIVIGMFALSFRGGRSRQPRREEWVRGRSHGRPAPVQNGPAGDGGFQAEAAARRRAEERAKEAEERVRDAEGRLRKALEEVRAAQIKAHQEEASLRGPLEELRRMQGQLQEAGERLRRAEGEREALRDALQAATAQAEAVQAEAGATTAEDAARAEELIRTADARAEAADEKTRTAEDIVARAQSEVRAAETRAAQAEDRARLAEGSVAESENRVRSIEALAMQAEQKIAQAEEKATRAETRASEAERGLKEAQAAAGADSDERVRLAEDRAAQAEDRARLAEARAADASALLGEAERRADEAASAMEAATAEAADAAARMLGFETQAGEAVVRAQGLDGRLAEAQHDLQNAEARAEQAATRVLELETQVARREEEARQLQATAQQDVDGLRTAHRDELEGFRTAHRDELEGLRTAHAQQLQQSQEHHTAKVTQLSQELEGELTRVRQELTAQLDQAREELEAQLEQERRERAASQTELESARQQLAQAREQTGQLEELSRVQEDRARHAEGRLTELQTELQELKGQDLSEELRLARAQERRAAEQLQTTQEKLAQAQSEARQLHDHMKHMEATATAEERPDLEAVVRVTQERLAGASKRLQQMEERAHTAERELQALREQVEREAEDASRQAKFQEAIRAMNGERPAEPTVPAQVPASFPASPLEDRRAAGPFLAALSMDARNSLTRILGLVLTLKHQQSPGEQAPLLKQLASHTRKLDHVVSDLLEADRLARGFVPLNLRRTDIEALTRRVIDESGVKGERQIHVRSERVIASVDPIRVEQIVAALLTGSVNRTGPGETLYVSIEPADEGGVVIAVDDDEPSSDASISPVVTRFAAMHGGWARVEGRSGGGSSFRVFLPEAPPETSEPPPADARDESPTPNGSRPQVDVTIELPGVELGEVQDSSQPAYLMAASADPRMVLRELGMMTEPGDR